MSSVRLPIDAFADPAESDAIMVVQGEWAVARRGTLHTLLGSCVAVCLFDPVARIGGMNHYVYSPRPGARRSPRGNASLSGDVLMEELLDGMLEAGARKERLRAKAFGGGMMFEHRDVLSVGRCNSRFARHWLEREDIPLELTDFHGRYARKLVFYPETGEHRCQRLPTTFPRLASIGGFA